MDRDEMHHKMSKKVAQLTKVIFHLNTRNEEADLHLQAVSEAYEKEVELILSSANAKVKQAMEAAERAKEEGASQKLEASQKQFEEEKRSAHRELEGIREASAAREQKNASMWTEKLRSMAAETAQIRQQCSEKATQFKDALGAVEKRFTEKTVQLVASHEEEIVRLRRDHGKELVQKAQEREDSEADLRRIFEARLRDAEQRRQLMEAELEQLRSRLDASLAEGGSALKSISEERDRLVAQLAQLQADLERVERLSNERAESLRQREEELGALREAVESAQGRCEQQRTQILDLTHRLTETEAELRRLREERHALEQRALRAERAATADGAAALQERRSLAERLRALEKVERLLRQELDSARAELELLRESGADEKRRLEAEIARLQSEIQWLQRGSEATTAEKEQELRRLNEELANLKIELQQLTEAKRDLQQTLTQERETWQKELAECRRRAAAELEAVKTAHEDSCKAMRAQHEQHFSELEQAHKEQLACRVEDLEKQIEALRLRLAETEAELRSDVDSQLNEAAKLRELLAASQKELQLSKQRIEELLQTRDGLQDKLASSNAEIEKMTMGITRLESEHLEAIKVLKAQHKDDMASTTRRHAVEIEELNHRLSKAIADKGAEGEAEAKRLQEELERIRKAHALQVKALEERLAELDSELEASKRAAKAELEQVRGDLQHQLSVTRGEASKMVQQLHEEHNAKMTEIYERHSVSLKELREKLGLSHQERVDEMRAKYEAQTREAQEFHKGQIDEMAAKHVAGQQHLAAQHKVESEAAAAAAREAADKYVFEIQRAEVALSEERCRLQEESQRRQDVSGQLVEAQSRIRALEQEIIFLKRSHEEEYARRDQQAAHEKNTLKEQHKHDMERLLAEQLDETLALKEQFDRSRLVQEQQIQILHTRIQELQRMYDERPSREEDVDRIAQLQEQVTDFEAQVKKLVEEMRFYKLELVNREQNYNKVFGATPNVGTLNPLSRKDSLTDAPKMRLVGTQQGLPPLGVGGGLGVGPGSAAPPLPRKSLHKGPSNDSLNMRRPTQQLVE